MLKIRLSRGGRKNLPFYRIVATNSTSPRDSKFLEKLGTYNPLAEATDPTRLTINKERVEHWLSVGAKPTDRVAGFLIQLGCKGAEKYKPDFEPRKTGDRAKKKRLEKEKAANEAANSAKEAAEAEANAAKEAAKAAKEAEAAAKAAPAVEAAPAETPAAEEAKS